MFEIEKPMRKPRLFVFQTTFRHQGGYSATTTRTSTLLGHLSHSGNLLLWVGVRRRASCVVRRSSCVNIFSSETTGPIITKFSMYHL